MPDSSAKAQLLQAVIEHFSTDGLADQSLRQIASAVGSSHRMLIYHFGSKDGLLVEVVRAVEARTLAQVTAMASSGAEAPDEVIRQAWEHVADPTQGDFERLFFALYGRALQGDEHIRTLLGDTIESWLDANVAVTTDRGIPAETARVHARLGLAVTRGLLLDLLATGDRAGADAALELFAQFYADWRGDGSIDRAS